MLQPAALEPVRYVYRNSRDEEYVGFIAEDVPELVATNDRKSLAAMDIVAVLTKVVKELKAENEQLKKEMANLKLAHVEQQQKLAELEVANAARLAALEGKIEMLVRAMAAGQMAKAGMVGRSVGSD
jgi:FtsZ-binding cell division protein ZapB